MKNNKIVVITVAQNEKANCEGWGYSRSEWTENYGKIFA